MSRRQLALAVLLVNGRYLLQLRDDKPGIDHPGVWGLFGGSVEPGEDFITAIRREVEEELCIRPDNIRFLETIEYADESRGDRVSVAVFEADITPHWGRHRLTEGQAARHFTAEQLAGLPMPPVIRTILAKHHAKMALKSAAESP